MDRLMDFVDGSLVRDRLRGAVFRATEPEREGRDPDDRLCLAKTPGFATTLGFAKTLSFAMALRTSSRGGDRLLRVWHGRGQNSRK